MTALDAAATVYAVLVASEQELQSVESRDRTRRARERFLREMVEPAGFTQDQLIAYLEQCREGLTPDQLQPGGCYVTADAPAAVWLVLEVGDENIIYVALNPRVGVPGLYDRGPTYRAERSNWERPVFRQVPHPPT